jgi:hypothetical protein
MRFAVRTRRAAFGPPYLPLPLLQVTLKRPDSWLSVNI